MLILEKKSYLVCRLRKTSVESILLIMLIIMSQLSRKLFSMLITLSTLSITILTRFFYVYITKIVFLNRNFVLNLYNSQYALFYCLNYLQTLVYNSKKFITLFYLCLYFILLIEQLLHFKH